MSSTWAKQDICLDVQILNDNNLNPYIIIIYINMDIYQIVQLSVIYFA